jgi:hypothetical protein
MCVKQISRENAAPGEEAVIECVEDRYLRRQAEKKS